AGAGFGRSALAARGGRRRGRCRRGQPEVVLHVTHAAAGLGDVFGAVLLPTLVHRTAQGDGAVLDLHRDARCIHVIVVHQAFVHVLADALVGARVVAWPKAAAACETAILARAALAAVRVAAAFIAVAG